MFIVYIIRAFKIIFTAVLFICKSIDQKKKGTKYFNYLNWRKISNVRILPIFYLFKYLRRYWNIILMLYKLSRFLIVEYGYVFIKDELQPEKVTR